MLERLLGGTTTNLSIVLSDFSSCRFSMTSASNASGARARADDYEGSTRLRQSGGRHRIGGSSNDSELSSSPSRCWKESAAIDIPGKGIKEAWNGSHEVSLQINLQLYSKVRSMDGLESAHAFGTVHARQRQRNICHPR